MNLERRQQIYQLVQASITNDQTKEEALANVRDVFGQDSVTEQDMDVFYTKKCCSCFMCSYGVSTRCFRSQLPFDEPSFKTKMLNRKLCDWKTSRFNMHAESSSQTCLIDDRYMLKSGTKLNKISIIDTWLKKSTIFKQPTKLKKKHIEKENKKKKMHTIAVLFFFAFLATVTSLPIEDFSSFQVPIQQHFIDKEALKEQKINRLAKLNGKESKTDRSKIGQKLLEVDFPLDYITANVSIGTPAQNFTVILSSGATRLLIASTDIQRKFPRRNYFDPSKSSTYKDLNKQFDDQDGSFKFYANFGSDTFGFGKAKIRNQAFGLTNYIYEESNNVFPFDGVFGFNHLGPNAYKDGKEPTSPIDNLLRSLSQKIVTVYLDKAKKPSQGPSSGLITFGDIDRQHCNEYSHNIIPLNASSTKDNRFTFNISRFSFGNDIELNYPGNGYLDSSISTIALPLDIFHQVIIKTKAEYDWGLDLYTVPCDSIHSMSRLVFSIGTGDDIAFITINPENYVIDLELQDGKCVLAIELADWDKQYNDETFVLGTPAFRSNNCYTYDFDENVIKLYYHKH